MAEQKKVALITGGNRGIGLQTAKDLGKQGVTVVIGVRELSRAEGALKELKAAGIIAEAVVYDSEKPETDQGVYEFLEKRHGKLDILINNAGGMTEKSLGPSTLTLSQQSLRETFDMNFFSVVRLTQTLLPLLRKSPAGRIVNLSSVLGSLTVHSLKDSPIAPMKELAYNASKSALNAFTVHLALALKDTPIKVNSAHPGWVKTELGGAQAPMEIADSAKTSVRLALLDAQGPTGGFFHENETLPW